MYFLFTIVVNNDYHFKVGRSKKLQISIFVLKSPVSQRAHYSNRFTAEEIRSCCFSLVCLINHELDSLSNPIGPIGFSILKHASILPDCFARAIERVRFAPSLGSQNTRERCPRRFLPRHGVSSLHQAKTVSLFKTCGRCPLTN